MDSRGQARLSRGALVIGPRPAGPRSSVDDALARRIRSGDREALGELYDRHASIAFATAVRIVADRGLAEDLVHDAFVAVWQKIDRFDASRGALRSWLLRIVRNRAIDRVRAQRKTMELGEADAQYLLQTSADPTWDKAVARRSANELRAVLDILPEEQRHAVDLAYFEGYTFREIAKITGVPEGTASGRLRLALGKLREALRTSDAGPGGWSNPR